MGDTYTGNCKICGEETDLIQGKCQECSLKSLDWQLGFLEGRMKELERSKIMISNSMK